MHEKPDIATVETATEGDSPDLLSVQGLRTWFELRKFGFIRVG